MDFSTSSPPHFLLPFLSISSPHLTCTLTALSHRGTLLCDVVAESQKSPHVSGQRRPPLPPPVIFILFPFASSSSSGQRHQRVDEQEAGAARALHGGDHGRLLSAVLAALRHHGPAGHLRPTRPGHPGSQHHPVGPGQDEHGHQPSHLRLHE